MYSFQRLLFAWLSIVRFLETAGQEYTAIPPEQIGSPSSHNVTVCDVEEVLIDIYKELFTLREALNQTDKKVGDVATSLLNVGRQTDEVLPQHGAGGRNFTERSSGDYGLSEALHQASRAAMVASSGASATAFLRALKTMQDINNYLSPAFQNFPSQVTYRDCHDAFNRGERGNGVFTIRIGGQRSFRAWCDFDSSGGWTVIQRRFDGSVGFGRSRSEYVRGFGSLWGEHWLGLDAIRLLAMNVVKLSVYIEDYAHRHHWANYSMFYVADAEDHYRLSISGHVGTVANAFVAHNGSQFSTWDSDKDTSSRNCAADYQGGWWYSNCYWANLNGRYDVTGNDTAAMLWSLPSYTRMITSVMRIRSQQ